MVNKSEISKLESFAQLLKEVESIIIPKVQRDYVYGRQDSKTQNVLKGMLDNIIDAIVNDSTVILDFVYGGAFIREDNDAAGLIPLDGQQRLTTLFLLSFYASLLKDSQGKNIEDRAIENLLKFRYETRQSATDFCHTLLSDIRENLLKNYNPSEQNIRDLIIDDAKYLKTYDSDPTIISMLNVLDIIEKKCFDKKITNLQPCLWDRLNNKNNVLFYKLTLDKFGLTDDLYIKMNARGKKLTPFDILKSDMIAQIKSVDEEIKDRFSQKMDNEWIDIIWEYSDKEISKNRVQLDVTNEVDTKYSMLFHNIFRLEFFRRGLYESDKEDFNYNLLLSDAEGIKTVEEIFESLYSIHKGGGFKELWSKYFYFCDDVVGKDSSIRLFWKKYRNSVFEIALTNELSVPEIVYFYSMYLLYKNKADDECCKRCLRIIRNLISANVRAVDARTNKLTGFLAEVKYIIDKGGQMTYYNKDTGLEIDGKPHKLSFIQSAWNDEYNKQNKLSQADYEKLLKYENHQILNCSVELFVDYCTKDENNTKSIDTKRLFDLLAKYERLFTNDCDVQFYKLKAKFLDSDIEYMQYEPYMDKEQDGKKEKMRYFITNHNDWSDFFIKNNQRRAQENILQILEKISLDDDDCGFNIFDWKYYICKYREISNHEWTKYGMGVWDDSDKYPLDLIWLNSSQHSSSNLEWKMLTYLLWRKLDNNDSYQLDDHGCSPILLTACGVTIGFDRGNWVISKVAGVNIPNEIDGAELNVCLQDDCAFTVNIKKCTTDFDYIVLGQRLVQLIEEQCKPT